jgi:hypothetical protein
MTNIIQTKILISALASGVLSTTQNLELIVALANQPEATEIASQCDSSRSVRQLNLHSGDRQTESLPELDFEKHQVLYQGQNLGRISLLYKAPLPGELQARLAIESSIDRFLEYLQKQYKIVVLDESDHHVQVFIPNIQIPNSTELWKEFLTKVAFSTYDQTNHQLPALMQTFVQMLNSVTLSERGFSTLDVPILTKEQANVLAAWYFAVIRDVRKRQEVRQQQINELEKDIVKPELSEKERKSKAKELQDKQAMQDKEAHKYTEYFQKTFGKNLEEQDNVWQELRQIETQLAQQNLTKIEQRKLQKQQEKLKQKLVLPQAFIQQKLDLFRECGGDPFRFVQLDEQQNPDKFKNICAIAKNFNKTATDQINSTRGDIFSQCITEMYRLLENEPNDPLPQPLLTEHPVLPEVRSPGDESKEFCYSCGVRLDPKNTQWQVLRFMFERPSQRRQSASSEGRPHICASCSALAFASPLKVTHESVILGIESVDSSTASSSKIKDYLRMLTNKQMHLSAGRYVMLASEFVIKKTEKGNKKVFASGELGQVQYALAKVAFIFPSEVLADFNFYLVKQGCQKITLSGRHLIFIKGLMNSYGHRIINAGKEINMTLGDAVRYIQQDLPYLADYTLTKIAKISDELKLEKVRERYWQVIQKDLDAQGVTMSSDNQLAKKAKLYRDIAALTGITYAFAQSLESTAKKAMQPEDAEREVSKLIEKVDDAVAFCYYATLGDETKKSVQARLYHNPDNYFIYEQAKKLLESLRISNRQEQDEAQRTYLTIYADDVLKVYTHFAEGDYLQLKDWNELTYQLKLSLYTRFPELVRKLKSTSEK